MILFRDRNVKTNIEQYVAFLKHAYNREELFPFREICLDAGIDLIESRYVGYAYAFTFPDRRGIIYDPGIRQLALNYYLTKKISHHLLRHFDRKLPVCLAEREAEYFAVAAIDPPLVILEAPSWISLIFFSNNVQRRLTNFYSRPDKPLLL